MQNWDTTMTELEKKLWNIEGIISVSYNHKIDHFRISLLKNFEKNAEKIHDICKEKTTCFIVLVDPIVAL